MLNDPWLDRWLPHLVRQARGLPVLELGCGDGADTETLCAAGLQVVAIEIDPGQAERARRRAPSADVICADLRQPWPRGAEAYGAVVASLSLHYFPWAETVELVARIHRALHPGGLLACRLNSTEDHHFGATGHVPIEPHYYRVDGIPKRFFDEAAVQRLFAGGWRLHACTHAVTHKYVKPKALWEVVLERGPGDPVAPASSG